MDLKEFKKLAKQRGGFCLSEEYRTKMKWKCEKGQDLEKIKLCKINNIKLIIIPNSYSFGIKKIYFKTIVILNLTSHKIL